VADRRWQVLGALLVSAALVLSACGGKDDSGKPPISGLQTPDNHGYKGTYLETPFIVPDISLPDDAGDPYSIATATAPVKLVFFGYTNCPDICQIVMSTIASAVARLDAKQRADVQVAFVTTDPARDTGPVLRTYLDRLDPDFVGVTGKLDRIVDLGKPLKVYLADGKKLPGGGYEVEHSTYVFGVTGDEARVIWNQGTSPADMATDIIKLLTS